MMTRATVVRAHEPSAVEAYRQFNALADELSPDDWRALTRLPQKMAAYGWEPGFRQAFAQVKACLGADALPWLQGVTLFCLLPDAFAGRRAEAALRFLAEQGFRPLAFRRVQYDWQSFAMDWRYQLNDTTLDRIGLSEAFFAQGPGLMLLLLDETPWVGVPASVRLRTLKGASKPEARQGPNLRDILESTDRLIKFVHSADEPADVVRQLGVMFDRQALRLLLSAPPAAEADLSNEIAELYKIHPKHDLDGTLAWRRLDERLRQRRSQPAVRRPAQKLIRLLEAAHDSGELNWATFSNLLADLQSPPGWDELIVASKLIIHKHDGERSLIDSDGASAWLAAAGRVP